MKSITKTCSALLFMTVVTLFSISTVSAATDCANATIEKTGVNPMQSYEGLSDFMVKLDCPDDSRWVGSQVFYLTPELGKIGYTTFVAAHLKNRSVWVRTDLVNGNSAVKIVFINP